MSKQSAFIAFPERRTMCDLYVRRDAITSVTPFDDVSCQVYVGTQAYEVVGTASQIIDLIEGCADSGQKCCCDGEDKCACVKDHSDKPEPPEEVLAVYVDTITSEAFVRRLQNEWAHYFGNISAPALTDFYEYLNLRRDTLWDPEKFHQDYVLLQTEQEIQKYMDERHIPVPRRDNGKIDIDELWVNADQYVCFHTTNVVVCRNKS
jgi:hypothetical protein